MPKSREDRLAEGRVKSKELLMLQDVWRQAFRRKSLTIDFPSHAGAVRARMQLYNAVKLQKTGRDMMDLELVHAAEELEIVWVDDLTIRLQMRAKSDMMLGIAKALGTELDKYVDPEAQASAERLLRELGMESFPPAPEQAPQPAADPAAPIAAFRDELAEMAKVERKPDDKAKMFGARED